VASTVWKGHLTFGLVSLPVRLHVAARGETISFNQIHKHDGSRIKQVVYCQAEDKPIPRSELVKGYEYEKDKYVLVDDEDIKKVAPATAKVMEILEFVKNDEVDPVYLESSYYMAPEEAGEKPYALLFDALKKTGFVGIAKISMHNREHIVVLRPTRHGILLHTMYYADEVRKTEEFRTDVSGVRDKERELATMLINSLAAPFEPEKYKDTYRENIRAMIDAKIAGQAVVETPEPQTAQVIDIMEALKRSLALRKPMGTAEAAVGEQEATVAEPPKKRRSSGRRAAGG
jgi:DNA end-binding protein Ku